MGKEEAPCEASQHHHSPLHTTNGEQEVPGGKRGRRGVQSGGVTYTCGGGGGSCGVLQASGSAVSFFLFFPRVAISDAFFFVLWWVAMLDSPP